MTNNTTKGGYLAKIRAYIPWKNNNTAITIDKRPSISHSITSSSTTSSMYISASSSSLFDKEEDDNYLLITSANICIDATLSLISKLPVNYEMITQEFKLVHDYLDQTCHQFDHSRTIDQFANTDSKMGPEIKLFMNFISSRYSTCSWLRCIGLIMIAQKILYGTPREVKKQLLQQTKIGREFVNCMQKALLSNQTTQFTQAVKDEIISIVLENNKNLYTLMENICHDFANNDKQFELAYEQIIYYFGNQF